MILRDTISHQPPCPPLPLSMGSGHTGHLDFSYTGSLLWAFSWLFPVLWTIIPYIIRWLPPHFLQASIDIILKVRFATSNLPPSHQTLLWSECGITLLPKFICWHPKLEGYWQLAVWPLGDAEVLSTAPSWMEWVPCQRGSREIPSPSHPRKM